MKLAKNSNFNNTLTCLCAHSANTLFKSEYCFDFLSLPKKYVETDIETALIKDINSFLEELGQDFAYIGNQIPLEVADQIFYIDVLLYHTKLRCFIVVELKNDSFKPRYIGQLGFYISEIEKTRRCVNDNPTIGLLLCPELNRKIVDQSLSIARVPIAVATFSLK